jgi:murein DD-endopeptidase MepM/ murein hydrolase activator NlpD
MKRILAIFPIFIAVMLIGLYINPRLEKAESPSETSGKTEGTTQEEQGISDVVKSGETMFDIFQKHGLNISELFLLKEASAKVHRLRNISTGQPYRIELGADNSILSLTYQISDGALLTISRSDTGYRAEKIVTPYETRERKLGGIIESNLYEALGKSGKSSLLAYTLADVFSWDIDFTTDLRRGDTFKVVVEELWRDGRFQRYGYILAAEFVNNGITHRAYRFEGKDGRAGYYDEKGKSLQRSFLKAPLSYRRISSRFSYSRRHPILKIRRPHLAVDYVAPRGTPVSALGDGTVRFAGYKGPNGNLVIIRHPKGFTTYYGHLHKIRRGIRRGVRVAQGQIIGYVGSTGRATGPHLDFRMKKGNRFINPLRVNVPRSAGIPKDLFADYSTILHERGLELASIVLPPQEQDAESRERKVASRR